ncbi:hypothetical protein HanXRQr2_Chr08g0328521 [Helianthus annuus]|uniref:Uncharacterized protein n=1 Tax=Helianthus annuus TaxID=4232 RepID=A0A9K3ICY7_HELAN|nr:hypothetical protein HanXRQr2_Chr08g0328521 [Helianthus annuus]
MVPENSLLPKSETSKYFRFLRSCGIWPLKLLSFNFNHFNEEVFPKELGRTPDSLFESSLSSAKSGRFPTQSGIFPDN